MKITRTASKAKNGLNRAISMELPVFNIVKSSDYFVVLAESKQVPEFGNDKTHHDYTIEITAGEFISMIKAINNCSGEAREEIKKCIIPHAVDILKLLNMCAE